MFHPHVEKARVIFCSGTRILRQQVTQPVGRTLKLSSYFIRQEPLRLMVKELKWCVDVHAGCPTCPLDQLPVAHFTSAQIHIALIHFSPHTRPKNVFSVLRKSFFPFLCCQKEQRWIIYSVETAFSTSLTKEFNMSINFRNKEWKLFQIESSSIWSESNSNANICQSFKAKNI